ncbi:TetR/AcrR family transcriptional regulator [Paenibacillus sp. J22TS3]|uniref:TetR/AcrR family transcriptional regulator n=1 Tax=Paenibacillus sp. J22TS3 TaxID=2807192 RepID=UPI001B12B3A1|nr:TetR/AcrR family transcriptional regulator [Paenibacillus sp. J22TS3]GIP22454.1 TetR family transcriptional regulator [Paenibacillus sp. J22TS3]
MPQPSEPLEPWLEELLQSGEGRKLTAKQLKILESAVEVFAEKGYAAASTSEIAQMAGVAEGTIFRHYKTKKELLLSIVTPMMGKLLAPFILNNFNEVLEQDYPTFEDFLRAVLHNRLAFARKHLKIIKILLQEIPFQPALKEQFIEHIGAKIYDRFQLVIKHFQDKGELIEVPSFTAIRFAAFSAVGLFVMHLMLAPDMPWDEEKEIEMTIQLIMHGLAAK